MKKIKTKPTKNKMTISCTISTEANFKSICDFMNKNSNKNTINGNHSKKISAFMEKYFRVNYNNLSDIDKAKVNVLIATYTQTKNKNLIY